MTQRITKEIQKELLRPFTAASVGFRADAKKPDRSGRVRCVVYIDSRLARERLFDIDPEWTAEYSYAATYTGDPCGFQFYTPIECRLTVLGVTRTGVGQSATKSPSANTVKSAYSDALKRAAVEFGIGAYLYAFKQFYAQEKDCYVLNGDVKALNREAVLDLRKQYTSMIANKLFQDRFGMPTEYGTLADDERGNTAPDDEQLPLSPAPARTPPTIARRTK
jgi:hypothetical protein